MTTHSIISMPDRQLNYFTTSGSSWNTVWWIWNKAWNFITLIKDKFNQRKKMKELTSCNEVIHDQIGESQHESATTLKEERDILEKERDILKNERDILEKERDILKKERDILKKERDILEEENRQISLRLSATIASNLRDNNPNIVDLNDQYRSTKLSELFHELYDNQWTSAFSVLQKQLSEVDSIKFLLYIVMKAYSFADNKVTESWKCIVRWFLRNMNFLGAKETQKWLKDSRKATILEMLPELHKEFKDFIISQIDKERFEQVIFAEDIDLYIKECIRVCLLMVSSDPPIVLVLPNFNLLQNRCEYVTIAKKVENVSNEELDIELKDIESTEYGNSIDSNEKHIDFSQQDDQYTDKKIVKQIEMEDGVNCEIMRNITGINKCTTDEDENSANNFYDCQDQETDSMHQVFLKKDVQGYLFDRKYFREYTVSGKYIDFIVWPVVCLHEGGPILAKGIAQCWK